MTWILKRHDYKNQEFGGVGAESPNIMYKMIMTNLVFL